MRKLSNTEAELKKIEEVSKCLIANLKKTRKCLAEAYLESSRISTIELFHENINGF